MAESHFHLLLFILLKTVSDCSCFEKELLDHLFKDYDKDMRPVLNDSDTVTVTMGLSLHQIMDVDEKNQIMTTSVWARQKWYNPYLRWDKTKYGNLSTINVPSKKIWIPDIVLYNNADEDVDFRGYLDRLSTRVQINDKGLNTWLSPVMLRTKCKINVEFFPFDSQSCILKFGSWTYDGYRLDVQNESATIDLGMYIASAEWHLASSPVKRNILHYFCCPEPYPDVTFIVNIQRRTLFYLTNLILPLVVISVLITFVFTLPPESGERISLSITILLAMTVFMLLVTETIPPTSEVIPLIAKFYMAAMFEIALALIVTCYILRCYHTTASEVPPWMKRHLVGTLANFFGVKKSKALLKQEKEEQSYKKLTQKRGFLGKMIVKFRQEETGEKNEGNEFHGNGTANETAVEKLMKNYDHRVGIPQHPDISSHVHISHHDNCNGFRKGYEYQNGHAHNYPGGNKDSIPMNRTTNDDESVVLKILEKLEIISTNFQTKEKVDLVKEQWHIIAVVFDRVSMWTFAGAILITMSMIFYQAPGYVA
ncbi:neuronal acetylcholine receptor subunit alpha-10-like isoform X2 [Dendronephthya gigantea]|uniref:neuronal acetylcholine receptor subunit alpha-10-like isoform X2 n=1 Tax=Dendronephthya gigantea TaxID=151771 RepID=UPI00106969BE|nr:neuronal acetylcholine receptor subunit alpha-10-like isoform X2 [Dendronephthya gigantea]